MNKVIIVDAELFDAENNIVSNIVIGLFNAFNSEIGTFEIDIKRKILMQFETIYKDLNFITKYGTDKKFRKTCSQEPLESLSGLSSATGLKTHLTELKVNLEKVFDNIELKITNFNFTRQNDLHNYYLSKYVDGVFNYKIN